MSMQKTNKRKSSILTILIGFTAVMAVFNGLFIFLSASEIKTMTLLKKELVILEQNAQIIASSEKIYDTYKGDIEAISAVFPTEETISIFVQTLEGKIRNSADEYTFKFNTVTPIKDGDRLFLPLTLTMKTDLPRLEVFFGELEKLQYMTHITGLLTKAPDGLGGKIDTTISLIIYVQEPFSH